MIVGFTGTRNELTKAQRDQLVDLLTYGDISDFHHGDCVGADETAHCLVAMLPMLVGRRVKTHAHPGDQPAMRANCKADVTYEPKPMLERNRDIVDACTMLIAAPDGPERVRSGTWSTVRYARKLGKNLVIVWPDGKLSWSEDAATDRMPEPSVN